MKKLLLFFISLLIAVVSVAQTKSTNTDSKANGGKTPLAPAAVVCYVTPGGAGLFDGTSWDNAYPGTQLQTAIDNSGITEVWVKKGTYTTGSDASYFRMKNNVAIYGGFSGSETSLSQRTDFGSGGANETIFNGHPSYYSWNIFRHEYADPSFTSLNASAILDGFTLTSTMMGAIYNSGISSAIFSPTIRNCTFTGNFDGAIQNYYSSPSISNCNFSSNQRGFSGMTYSIPGGGAIYNVQSSPTIQACTFSSNISYSYGGAIFDSSNSSPKIVGCTFTSNQAYSHPNLSLNYQEGLGGAIYNDATSPSSIISCVFYSNISQAGGGGVFNRATYPMPGITEPTSYISNCTFCNNQSSANGGAIYVSGSVFVPIVNSILRGNISAGSGNNFYLKDAYVLLSTSCYSNGTNDVAGSGSYTFSPDLSTITDDPMFVNSASGDLRLYSGSPCVNTGYTLPYLPSLDVRGKARVQNTYVDMGAYEWTSGTDPVTQSTWTGATDTDWNTAGNWSTGFAPKYWRLCDVTIPDVTNDPVVNQNITDTALVNNLTIQTGAVLTIAPGKAFTVNGTLTNAAVSGLVIKSDATGTGSLIQNSSSASATVERYISGWGSGTTHGWHLLSSTVSAQLIAPAFTDPTPENYDFFCWDEPSNTWVNYKNTTVSPTFGAANYLGHLGTPSPTSCIPGKGYLAAYLNSGTRYFTGTLVATDVLVSNLSISSGTNKGWHLLGNPFTAALTWGTADWLLSHINATAKIWQESTASYVDITSGSGIIPGMNGFMVEVTATYGLHNSITIPAAARKHSATAWYKSTGEPAIALVAHDQAGNTAQESILRFNPEATGSFDPAFDSHFLPGFAPQFFSVAGEEHLSTNTLPEVNGSVQVPFDFIKNDGSSFSIEARSITDIQGPVILNDLKTAQRQDLTVDPLYSFTSSSGDNPSRFLITFSHAATGETREKNPLLIYSSGNTLFVTGKNAGDQGNIYVYNMMGQLIKQQELDGSNITRITLEVVAGYYLVKAVTNRQTCSARVFLQ